ncbi:MAG: hypothetical protein KIT31_14340 [Deltaproteobacteria bacterium]|nr:hypothetical protein [Deltaproteobacteria bacterium]
MTMMLHHRVCSLRHCGALHERTDLQVRVEIEPRGTTVRFTPPPRIDDAPFAVAIARAIATATAHLPGELTAELVVEAGVVEQTLLTPETSNRHTTRYLMACWRGVLLGLGDLDIAIGEAIGATSDPSVDIDLDIPVVLGPSAAFAAALHAWEFAGPEARLEISTEVQSPYPPHAFPRELIGTAFQPALLRMGGCSRPFAALANDACHTAALRWPTAPLRPTRALVVDALQPFDSSSGPVTWEAQCSVFDGQELAPLPHVRRISMDAVAVLSQARALGPLRPALSRDAVWGDTYGTAPAVIVPVVAGALLS